VPTNAILSDPSRTPAILGGIGARDVVCETVPSERALLARISNI